MLTTNDLRDPTHLIHGMLLSALDGVMKRSEAARRDYIDTCGATNRLFKRSTPSDYERLEEIVHNCMKKCESDQMVRDIRDISKLLSITVEDVVSRELIEEIVIFLTTQKFVLEESSAEPSPIQLFAMNKDLFPACKLCSFSNFGVEVGGGVSFTCENDFSPRPLRTCNSLSLREDLQVKNI